MKQLFEKANQLISASVATGYLPALFYKGELASKKNDIQQAKEWYTKAAISHYIPAEMALSRLYTQEKGPLFNPNLGFVWMMKAAQNGGMERCLLPGWRGPDSSPCKCLNPWSTRGSSVRRITIPFWPA